MERPKRCPNNTITCYSGTPNPGEAYIFAAFMSSDEAMQTTRAVPSRKAVATGTYLNRTADHTWQVQVDALTEHLKLEPRTANYQEMDRTIDEAWHEVLDGVKEAAIAVQDVIPKLEAILQQEV